VSKTKLVEYGTQWFWAYDVALGIFLKHLIDASEASDHANASWLRNDISSWQEVACIQDFGLAFDAGMSAAERQTLIILADKACSQLATREYIPAEEIVAWPLVDDLHICPRGATEVLTAPIVELGRAVMALISGELPEAPPGQTWLYGTETGRHTIGRREP
jgi:hypothetical protein